MVWISIHRLPHCCCCSCCYNYHCFGSSNHKIIEVPNVSFTVYAPGFLSRFIESHAVMFQGNAGLKPKEGEVTSRPWQWPINYRVSFLFLVFTLTVIFVSISILSNSLFCLQSFFPFIHFKIPFILFSQGQFFSGSAYRIYLLGNPIIWWSNLVFLAIFLILFLFAAVRQERGYQQTDGEYLIRAYYNTLVNSRQKKEQKIKWKRKFSSNFKWEL